MIRKNLGENPCGKNASRERTYGLIEMILSRIFLPKTKFKQK